MKQDLASRQLRAQIQQGQHVLELIAEAERAAALVKAGSRKQAGIEHLIGQPAVNQQIETALGRARFQGGSKALRLFNLSLAVKRKCLHRSKFSGIALKRLTVGSLAQEEMDIFAFPGLQRDVYFDDSADVEPCTDLARELDKLRRS